MLENAEIESREDLYTSVLLIGDIKGQIWSTYLLLQIANIELDEAQGPAHLISAST